MKLVFFDIDGTLAMPGNAPGQATVEAIRACHAKGNKVLISTGRTKSTVPESVMAIGFDGGIYSAGGRVQVDGQELQKVSMSPELVRRITDVMEEEQINYTLECEDCLYEGTVELVIENPDSEKGSSELRRLMELRKRMGYRRPIREYHGEDIYKVTYMATDDSQIETLMRRLSGEAKVVCFKNFTSEAALTVGEISDYKINKGAALELICAYYQTDASQCIAFGDSMNDMEILQAAGLGIAMGNSPEEVKALADKVCGSCEEDGVAEALKQMGLA
jgi:hypothetical protein